jgi:NAD(P)-dependent dehydrogenase (short-subunit alcohol dehydrogenase family)
MGIEQKVAVITGASQGIGAGLVKSFRDRNYRVVANSRSIKPVDDADDLTIAGDISKPETASQIVEEGVRRFGRIDSLINNAGIFIGKGFTDSTRTDCTKILAVNLAGFFYVTQAAIAQMARQGSSLSLLKRATSPRGGRAARGSVTPVKPGLWPGQSPTGPNQSIHRRPAMCWSAARSLRATSLSISDCVVRPEAGRIRLTSRASTAAPRTAPADRLARPLQFEFIGALA